MNKVKTGDTAKDFILEDQDGNDFHLSSLKGKRVLLSFHPLAWTKICARQMMSLEKNQVNFGLLATWQNCGPIWNIQGKRGNFPTGEYYC